MYSKSLRCSVCFTRSPAHPDWPQARSLSVAAHTEGSGPCTSSSGRSQSHALQKIPEETVLCYCFRHLAELSGLALFPPARSPPDLHGASKECLGNFMSCTSRTAMTSLNTGGKNELSLIRLFYVFVFKLRFLSI